MARRAYARRYAQALFEIALGKNELDRWQADLSRVASLTEDSELVALLQEPRVPFDAKNRLLSEQLGEVSPLVLNLVSLLLLRSRLGMIGKISSEYQRLLDAHHGLERAEVTAAIPLDDEDRRRLAEQLGKFTGKKVTVETRVNPGLVAGFTARVGGKLLDGSTRSKLLALEKELARGGQ